MHSNGFLEPILDSDYREKILSLCQKIREVRRVFVFWEKQAFVMIWNLRPLVQNSDMQIPTSLLYLTPS